MLPDSLWIVLAIILGLIVGSFLNVVIARLPKGESIVSPPSHCPACETPLRWWQNIPVLSFFLLGRKCYFCHEPISWRYPLIESLTAILFGLTAARYGFSVQTLSTFIFIGYLIPIALIDYEHFLIFDAMSYSGMGLGLIIAAIPHQYPLLFPAILGGVVGAGSLFVIRGLGNLLFHKESMGLGDIKLAGLIGIFLGWQLTLMSFFSAAVLIVLVYIVKAVIRSQPRPDERYPFGFYFSVVAAGMLFWGNNLLEIYLNYLHMR